MKFRLIDRILAYEPGISIRGVQAVSFEQYQFSSALDLPDKMPASLVLGALVELGSWMISLESQFNEMGFLVGFESITFDKTPGPGEVIELSMHLSDSSPNHAVFQAKGQIGSFPALVGSQVSFCRVPIEQFRSSEDLQVLYDQIGPDPSRRI